MGVFLQMCKRCPKHASLVDVADVVTELEGPMDVNLKAGGTKKRRNLVLLDDSGASCRLTLWGEWCDLAWQEHSVALVKQAKLGDFGGRSLSVNFATAVFLGSEAQTCH